MSPTLMPKDNSLLVPASLSPLPSRYITPALRKIQRKTQGKHLNNDENALHLEPAFIHLDIKIPETYELKTNLNKATDKNNSLQAIAGNLDIALPELILEIKELKTNLKKATDKNKSLQAIAGNLDIALLEKYELKRNMKKATDKNNPLQAIAGNLDIPLPEVIQEMIESASKGLLERRKPIRTTDGSGGAYFLLHPSGNTTVAVFKPEDEERNAANNHQGQLSMSDCERRLKRGTKVGEGAVREVAAYLLDHPLSTRWVQSYMEPGFSGVPPTIMVECLDVAFNHPDGFDGGAQNIKVGSLQLFMPSNGSCDNRGPQDFPVDEVHKIAVLDLRMANADRHAGNILFRCRKDNDSGKDIDVVFIPIDHGYSLPESFEDLTFEWLNWRQSREPFSADTLDYIRSLDADEDLAILKSNGLEVSHLSACTLRISTMLLKKGADRRLSPYDIGRLMCRETPNQDSVIEVTLEEARNKTLPRTHETEFLNIVSELLDVVLEQHVLDSSLFGNK